jgi:hypothetical protein
MSAIIFFILLSLRFGFWFFARAIRAASVAGQNQRIAWVELGYYLGMISGLIIWKMVGIDINLSTALIIDAILQFSAGFIDLYAHTIISKNLTTKIHEQVNATTHITHHQSLNIVKWKLAFAVIFLTVGIQVIILSLTHQFSEYFSAYIIATFYFGAAIAAFISKKLKISLIWVHSKNNKTCYSRIKLEGLGATYQINSILVSILSAFSVMVTIFCGKYFLVENHFKTGANYLFLLSICCAAFFYEVLALGLLDRIGVEEKISKTTGMVMQTYGMMGTSAAIGLWLISFFSNNTNGLLLTLMTCLVLTILMIQRKQSVMPHQQLR